MNRAIEPDSREAKQHVSTTPPPDTHKPTHPTIDCVDQEVLKLRLSPPKLMAPNPRNVGGLGTED